MRDARVFLETPMERFLKCDIHFDCHIRLYYCYYSRSRVHTMSAHHVLVVVGPIAEMMVASEGAGVRSLPCK